MAVGDIKGDEAVVVQVTPGENITKGQVIDCSANGSYFISADTSVGKFAVAIENMVSGTDGEAVIWGRVEVLTTAAIYAGQNAEADAAGTVKVAAYGAIGEVVGTLPDDIGSAAVGTIWVGLM